MPFAIRRAESLRERYGRGSSSDQTTEKMVQSSYLRWTYLVNRVCAALLWIPGLPLTVLLMLFVQMTSRGPGLYRQRRVGLRGRVFTLYKIRTMLHNAEAETGPVWTAPFDPRITKVGRLLRALHLDELPQLVNVLRGEMMLIGPRPERPEFTKHLARQIPGYMDRCSVLPGITGLAQVNLAPDTDIDSVRRKLVLDVEYISQANLKTDLRIICATALGMIGIPQRWTVRMFSLERHPGIPESSHVEVESAGGPAIYHGSLSSSAHSGNGVCRLAAEKEGAIPAA